MRRSISVGVLLGEGGLKDNGSHYTTEEEAAASMVTSVS